MDVYPLREDTRLILENLGDENLEGLDFLEMGCGNAEVSVKAARLGASVTGVDINEDAVVKARDKFESQDLEGSFLKSDLFENLEGRFDFIVFNPPYLDENEGFDDAYMWDGGENGVEVSKKFLESSRDFLKDDGVVWIIFSSKAGYKSVKEDYGLEVVDSRKLWFETLYLLKLE